MPVPKIAVFDFFCGCGGTSEGFREAGMDIVWALDVNPAAAKTYKKNFPKAKFNELDVNKLDIEELKREMEKYSDHLKLFCGCAPCQPFTKQKTQKKKEYPRASLLLSFAKVVEQTQQVGNAVPVPLAKAVGEEFLMLARSKKRGAA